LASPYQEWLLKNKRIGDIHMRNQQPAKPKAQAKAKSKASDGA
jgi:hypothetical protein